MGCGAASRTRFTQLQRLVRARAAGERRGHRRVPLQALLKTEQKSKPFKSYSSKVARAKPVFFVRCTGAGVVAVAGCPRVAEGAPHELALTVAHRRSGEAALPDAEAGPPES